MSGNTVVVGGFAEKAYLFNATTGALIATFSSPTPATGDQFGASAGAGVVDKRLPDTRNAADIRGWRSNDLEVRVGGDGRAERRTLLRLTEKKAVQ